MAHRAAVVMLMWHEVRSKDGIFCLSGAASAVGAGCVGHAEGSKWRPAAHAVPVGTVQSVDVWCLPEACADRPKAAQFALLFVLCAGDLWWSGRWVSPHCRMTMGTTMRVRDSSGWLLHCHIGNDLSW